MTATPTISQPVANIVVRETRAGREGYTVGNDGITLIDVMYLPMPSRLRTLLAAALGRFPAVVMVPYLRVWAGQQCIASFPQHRVQGVYFAASQQEIDDLIASDPTRLLAAFRDVAAQDQL